MDYIVIIPEIPALIYHMTSTMTFYKGQYHEVSAR